MGHLAEPNGERLGKEIGNSIGEFMEFDPNYRRSFMRIRARLDPARPLLRGKLLKLDKQKENIWVPFRYERLFKFCYFCGHLDHIQKDCAALVEELENGHRPVLQYNESLKTASLTFVTSPDANIIQRPNKKLIGSIAVEASRIRSKVPAMESNTKRLKVGNTNENAEDATNIYKRKDVNEGAKHNLTSIPKSDSKGMKTSSPNRKPGNRSQNDSSAK